jgi:hypothetical protein
VPQLSLPPTSSLTVMRTADSRRAGRQQRRLAEASLRCNRLVVRYLVTVIAEIRVVPGSVVSVITNGRALPIRYEGLAAANASLLAYVAPLSGSQPLLSDNRLRR